MQPRHIPSPAAYALIQRFEGFRARAARLADGRWTVGYGHVASARQGVEVSESDARDLLTWDLRPVARAVNAHAYAPLTQNQFDALIAFAFNVGVDAFRRSNVLRALNAGRPLQAAQAIETWRRADWEGEPQVIDALVRRRAAEKALFLTPADGDLPVPGAVLRPQSDLAAAPERLAPLELVTPLDGEDAAARRLDAADFADPDAAARPSASAAAADAVSDRLRALFPVEPASAPPAAGRALSVGAAPPAVTAANDGPANAAPIAALELPDLEPDPTLSLAPPSPHDDNPDDADRDALLLEPVALAEDPRLDLAPVPAADADGSAERAERWPFFLLFIGGAGLFVTGIYAAMQTGQPSAVGWIMGIAGAVLIAVAVYFLLQRGDEA